MRYGSARVDEPPLPSDLLYTIEAPRSAGGRFFNATVVDVGPDGRVYVLDTSNHRVQVFGPDGELRDMWGSAGREEGRFAQLLDLAVGPDGTVWIVDAFAPYGPDFSPSAAGRVQRFSADGRFLGTWSRAVRVADIGPDGSVYAVEGLRVSRYGPDGVLRAAWGRRGSREGQFDGILALSVAEDGTVYVADSLGRRVQRFDPDGRWLDDWFLEVIPEDTEVDWLAAEAAPGGGVYVSSVVLPGRGDIWRFDAAGKLLGRLEGWTGSPTELAAGRDGSLYVLDQYAARIARFSGVGHPQDEWGQWAEPAPLAATADIAAAGEGLAVLDDSVVNFFGPEGAHRHDVDLAALQPARTACRALTMAPDGSAFVETASGILHLSAAGEVLHSWPLPGIAACTTDLAATPDGGLVVALLGSGQLRRLDAEGRIVAEWGGRGPADGLFPSGLRVAAAPDGSVFTVDPVAPDGGPAVGTSLRVQHFAADGRLAGAWRGIERTRFGRDVSAGLLATDIAVSADGRVLVTVREAPPAVDAPPNTPPISAVLAFEPTGGLLGSWGAGGFGVFGGFGPRALAAGGQNTAFVLDAAAGGLYEPPAIRAFGQAQGAGWRASYYADGRLTGWPVAITRTASADLDLDWGGEPPAEGVPAAGFGATFERTATLEGGIYRLVFEARGGASLWAEPWLAIDRRDAASVDETATLLLPAGPRRLVVELAAPTTGTGGHAAVRVGLERVGPIRAVHLPVVGR